MAYAPLFHEVHSELFLALCRTINAIAAGTRMTRADILQQLPNLDWGGLERANALIDTLFLFQPDGSACRFLDNGIAARVTTAELVWLRAMLEDPGAAFLLPDNLREKLRQTLAAVPEWPRKTIWQTVQEQGDDRTALQGRLAIIWQALREKRQLAYANRDSRGQLHEGICSPCRLEYDAAANCYYLIIWQPDEARAIKMRVARLASVQCLDAPIPAGTEEAFHHFLADRRQSVTLRIERSFMMFASYDKEASYDEEADTYTIQLYYYDFDRREILQQILSLGAAVTVLAPADMREAIIERLQAAWQTLQ
ncbi:WYL domain-containing protein [Mitsuokella jalaludinii]|uniref:WYL domain-containing protein n=1 Tax=Mitsuokella jalaludinii TaxID=187979 RepID=UPI002FDA66D3